MAKVPSHPGEPYLWTPSRTPERSITEAGVRQYTGPLYAITVAEAAGVGTLTLTISDPAGTLKTTAPVKFESTINSVTTSNSPTTAPSSGVNGTYTYVFDLDPLHVIIIAPVLYLASGVLIRPGAETFDSNTIANVVNISETDLTATTDTIVVQFDTDTAVGANHARWNIDGGSWTDEAVASDRSATFVITVDSSAHTLTVEGQNPSGAWGTPVSVTVRKTTGSGGPNLVVDAAVSGATAVITWSGDGVLVAINGGSPATPGSSPWTVSRPALGADPDTYSFKGTLDGQTVTDTVFIPALDASVQEPDATLSLTSSDGTTMTFSLVVHNPLSGGTAIYTTVFFYYCSATFDGTPYVNTSVADYLTDGTAYTIVVTRPEYANPDYSGAAAYLRVRCVISGGGGEDIQHTIPNQDAAPGSGIGVISGLAGEAMIHDTGTPLKVTWDDGGYPPGTTFNISWVVNGGSTGSDTNVTQPYLDSGESFSDYTGMVIVTAWNSGIMIAQAYIVSFSVEPSIL